MSRISIAIVAVCGVAVGVLGGLLVALLAGGSPAGLAAERDRLVKENEELRREVGKRPHVNVGNATSRPSADTESSRSNLNDWGIVKNVAARFGPGSPFMEFANALANEGDWDSYAYWSFKRINAVGTSDSHLVPRVVGEGKVYIEAVITAGLDDLMVTLLFTPGEGCDLDQAVGNFNDKVTATGRAMGLTAEEVRRLKAVVSRVPLCRPNAIREGMLLFAGDMPDRAQARFAQCLLYYEDEAAAKSAKVMLDGDGPAIGFALSDQRVLEVAFMGTELGDFYSDVNYFKPGPWWSILIYSSKYKEWTSADDPKELSTGEALIGWPRLTTAEVDLL